MVCGDIVKIIDVQFTESARLSQMKTQSKELLLRDDCRAVAMLFRTIFWHVDKDLLPPIEKLFQEANSVDDLNRLLTGLRSRSQFPDAVTVKLSDIDGLTQTDLEVLRLAGDQVVNNNRFPGRISVPEIIEKTKDAESVFGAIRLLTELGYFNHPRAEFPRVLMITFYGFDRYLVEFRSEYASEYRRVCIAIIREEPTRDIDIAAITEIQRPIVEHVINTLTTNELITSTRYNSETCVHSVSERLKREFNGI